MKGRGAEKEEKERKELEKNGKEVGGAEKKGEGVFEECILMTVLNVYIYMDCLTI